MKIGYHFDADYAPFNGLYGFHIEKLVFEALLSNRSLDISSKLFIGDLFLYQYLSANKDTTKPGKSLDLLNDWLYPKNILWVKFPETIFDKISKNNIFVICFESIDLKTTEYLHNAFKEHEAYLGSLEVDDSSNIHWNLYSNSLVPFGRIINKNLWLFCEDENEDKDTSSVEEFRKLGFEKIDWELLNMKYSIFDKYHNFEEARRIAEWKRKSGALLAFITDDIVSRLSDIAPDLGNKLWATLKTFEEAETNEEFAQVAVSCRRIFEYATDSIFPFSDEMNGKYSLQKGNYRNRLLAYADESKRSDTNLDLITVSTEMLSEQWTKINNLSNKGIHSDVFRPEARRCLIRTIILLDDIVSLKGTAFQIKPILDFEDIFGN